MHLAHALPWWLALLLIAAIGAATFVEYRRPLSPLTRAQRAPLAPLRARALSARSRPHGARAVPVAPDRVAASSRPARRGRADPDRRVPQHAPHRCRQPV